LVGVAPTRTVSTSASIIFPCSIKIQKTGGGEPSLNAAQPFAKAEGRVFLLVPAYPGCPGTEAIKRGCWSVVMFVLQLTLMMEVPTSKRLYRLQSQRHYEWGMPIDQKHYKVMHCPACVDVDLVEDTVEVVQTMYFSNQRLV